MLGGADRARPSTPVATTDSPFPEEDQAMLDNSVEGGLIATATPGALAIIRASTPDFPPGERALYSNSNYILLGDHAEQVSGHSIESLIEGAS